MTIEEINGILANKQFVDPTTLPKSVEKSVFDKTASELSKVKKELAELKATTMSDDEKVNAAIAKAESKEKEFTAKLNRLDVEKLFVAEGLTEADYAELIDDIVSEDAEKTMKLANNVLSMVKSQKSAAEKALKAELLKKTPKPPAGDGDDKGITLADFRKMSPQERYQFSVNNPEEYKKLYGGNE
jgi:HEPN domain-containing protein